MNYFRILQNLKPLIESGKLTRIDEALSYLQSMGMKIDGIVRKGVENMFKKIKARDPEFGDTVVKMSIDEQGIPFNPNTLKSTSEKRGVANLFEEKGPRVTDQMELFTETKKLPKVKMGSRIDYDKIAAMEGIDVELIRGKEWSEIMEIISAVRDKADGGRVGFNTGGWHPGAGRDKKGYQKTHPQHSGGGDGPPSITNPYVPPKKPPVVPVSGSDVHPMYQNWIRPAAAVKTDFLKKHGWYSKPFFKSNPTTSAFLHTDTSLGGDEYDKLSTLTMEQVLNNMAGGKYDKFPTDVQENLKEQILGKVDFGDTFEKNWSTDVVEPTIKDGKIDIDETKLEVDEMPVKPKDVLEIKDGGRVGYANGGLNLTGQAKNIYDSWIAAGHSSQDALNYLSSRGMYDAGGGGIESIINTQQSIIPQSGGGGNETWDPNTAQTKMFNKDVWTEIAPNKYDWVNTEIEGFLSPTGWKTAEGKNINHAGLYSIRPLFSYLFDRGAPYKPGGKYRPGSIKGAWQERQDRIKLEQAAAEQQRQETARQIAAAAQAFQSTGDYDEFSGAGGNVDPGGPASRMDWSDLTDDEGDKYATGGVATMFPRRR